MLDTLARVDVKRPLPDGRRQLVMTGVEMLDKLVPLIPHRQVMNQCTAWPLRADEPPARQGRPPASVDQ